MVKTQPFDHPDAAVRSWLLDVMRRTGLKPTPLAKAAGLAPSTLLRALDEANPATLERRTIDKIVASLGVPPPKLYGGGEASPAGFAEGELTQIPAGGEGPAGPLGNTEGEWIIRTRALELAGYLPGDLVIADSAVPPRARDVVVAQEIDHLRGSAETRLRIYDPPYLVTETADPAAKRKPLLVDGDRVAIWGPVVRSLRLRAAG